MSWVAVGTAVVGGAIQYKGQKDASKAAQQGYAQANQVNQQALDQARADYQPYMALGQTGVSGLQRLLTDPNSIQDSAAYQWTRQQGLQGLDRSAAARGSLWSGGADADRMAFASGLASQEYGNQWNRLAGLAQGGQNATMNLGALGQGYAGNVAQNTLGAAGARATGYQNQSNVLGQLAYGVGGTFNDWNQARKASAIPSSGYGTSMWGQQMNSGAGANVNFGNNVNWWG